MKPFWLDSYDGALDALWARLEGAAWSACDEGAGPGEVLDRILVDLGGAAHLTARQRFIDAGWTCRAGVWSHPEDITGPGYLEAA